MIVQHPDNLVSDAARATRGGFRIDDLPPGPGVVVAYADGFAPYVGTISIEAGEQYEVTIGLLLEGVASGRVLDANGSAVAGAVVNTLYAHTAGGLLKGYIGGLPISDAEGRFGLNGLVPDTAIALRAELGGRVSEVVTVTGGPGMIRQNIVLSLP